LRQAQERRQLENRIADKITQFAGSTVQDEERQNEALLSLSKQILELTKAIHPTSTARASAGSGGDDNLRPPTSPASNGTGPVASRGILVLPGVQARAR
jgi:hypothetical protein